MWYSLFSLQMLGVISINLFLSWKTSVDHVPLPCWPLERELISVSDWKAQSILFGPLLKYMWGQYVFLRQSLIVLRRSWHFRNRVSTANIYAVQVYFPFILSRYRAWRHFWRHFGHLSLLISLRLIFVGILWHVRFNHELKLSVVFFDSFKFSSSPVPQIALHW